MAEKQLIVAVEGTAALGPYWKTILSDYLEKIIRSFCGNDISSQKPAAVSFELALVMFTSHGSYCASLVQRSGWTKDVDIFLQWLSAIPFGGGGFNDAAIAEGLAEALMMFAPNGSQTQQNVEVKKHCVLVSASNPYPLPTPIYRPKFQSSENEVVEAVAESRLSDAETIAKSYSQGFVSLSVICPKQLPKLRTIFNAGKRNPRSPDPPVDNKNAHSLVLVSENFMEARAALSRSGVSSLPSTQSPIKMDIAQTISVSGPLPASVPSANGVILNRQPVPAGNGPTTIVKVEPTTVTSMAAAPTFPHVPPVPRPTPPVPPVLQTSSPPVSQEASANIDTAQDMKPVVSGGLSQQPARPAGPANSNILNNLSQVRQVVNSAALTGGTSIALQTMNQNPMAMHVSNMISSGMQSSIPAAQNVYSSGQSGVTSMTVSGTGAQNPALGSFAPAASNMSGNSNLGMSQPTGNLQVPANMAQSVQGMSQGNLSGPQMVGMNQNIMNGLAPAGSSSGNGSMMPTPGMTQQGMQSIAGGNNPGANMPLAQQSSSAMQTAQSKYVKVWEGNLSGQRQGQPVFITRLEGYRSASASETLAANWPPTMQIVRLISQDHMNNKQYVGKADFLVFRAMNQHGFLGQLQEKKLCAVIQLPSQTLLLSVSDKACRLIGMLFPGDMVVFKPQMPSQQQLQQQQQPMQMQMQQQQPMQMQQQQPQQQQQPMQMQQQQQPQQQQQQQPQMPQLQQQQPQMPQLQQQQQMPQLQQQQMPQQQQMQQQQQQQQQPQLNQIQQQQQIQQMQQQRPPQQQSSQPMVGVGIGMGQGGYVQGPPRAQLVSQGQIPSQGQNSLPGGGGFMN